MESPLPPDFQKTADAISKVTNLNDSQKLQLYALYKQATIGPCNTPRPGFFDFVGKAKWDAWNSLDKTSRTEAATKYIELAKQLLPQDQTGEIDEKMKDMSVNKPKQKGMGAVFSRPQEEADSGDCPRDLCYWAQANNVVEVTKLLDSGVKIDTRDEEQRTALMWACDRGNLDMAKLLLSKNAQVNAQDKEGQTPLHYAVLTGEVQLVKLLLEHGVDKSIADNEGCRPSELAENAEIKTLLG